MTFLIDTNVISEIRRGDRCDPTVAAWWKGVEEGDLWLSPLVLGEIRTVPVVDGLLAATAKANGLTLVTRSVANVAGLDVDALNPFEA